MSLESSIATLTTAVQALMALPQTITNLATAEIAEVTATYNARLASLDLNLWVDQVNGLNTNPGTQELPLKTIKAAVAKVPLGGNADITCIGNYNMTEDVAVFNRTIRLVGDNTTRPRLTFERYVGSFAPAAGGADVTSRATFGFNLAGRGSLSVYGMTVAVPALDGGWPTYTTGSSTPPLRVPDSSRYGLPLVKLTYCNIEIPATPFGALCNSQGSPFALQISQSTATMTALPGYLFPQYTSTAGTDTEKLGWLVSNLDKI